MPNKTGWQGRPPKFAFDVTESEDLALFADAFPKLVAVGMQVPLSFLHEKLKIPLPVNGEAVLTSTSPLPPSKGGEATDSLSLAPFEGGGAIARGVCLNADNGKPVFTPEQQVIETIGDDLLENVNTPLSNAQLQQVIRAAKSPEDLENRLAILMAKADFSEFTAMLERSLFAADLLGYANAR